MLKTRGERWVRLFLPRLSLDEAHQVVRNPIKDVLQVVAMQLQLLEVAEVGEVGRLDLYQLVAGP